MIMPKYLPRRLTPTRYIILNSPANINTPYRFSRATPSRMAARIDKKPRGQ